MVRASSAISSGPVSSTGSGFCPSPTSLTARESQILRWLHAHRARAVSRGELLENVWDSRGDLQTRTVDMTIANLRQKIEQDPTRPKIVTTVKGVGYAWGDA